jgi:hypothetical protein
LTPSSKSQLSDKKSNEQLSNYSDFEFKLVQHLRIVCPKVLLEYPDDYIKMAKTRPISPYLLLDNITINLILETLKSFVINLKEFWIWKF